MTEAKEPAELLKGRVKEALLSKDSSFRAHAEKVASLPGIEQPSKEDQKLVDARVKGETIKPGPHLNPEKKIDVNKVLSGDQEVLDGDIFKITVGKQVCYIKTDRVKIHHNSSIRAFGYISGQSGRVNAEVEAYKFNKKNKIRWYVTCDDPSYDFANIDSVEIIRPTATQKSLKDSVKEQILLQKNYSDIELEKKGGPYIGPRGGKWADPKRTIPWKESGVKKPAKQSQPEQAKKPEPEKELTDEDILIDVHKLDEEHLEAVKDLLNEIGYKAEDIKELRGGAGMSGNAIEIEVGSETHLVFENSDGAEEEAIEYVKSLIDDIGVTGFSDGFWQQHVDWDKIGDELGDDEYNFAYDEPESYLHDEEPEGDDDEWSEAQREKAGDMARDNIKSDPQEYLRGMYNEDSPEYNKFIEPYVDQDALVQDAVDTDGIAHSIATYDGNELDLKGGYIAYRTN